jgi:hypothetical protein
VSDCNHDGLPKETLREHMIRAHGCTEAMVRWVFFSLGFGFAIAVCSRMRREGKEPGLLSEDVQVFGDSLYPAEPSGAAGFAFGYRFAVPAATTEQS